MSLTGAAVDHDGELDAVVEREAARRPPPVELHVEGVPRRREALRQRAVTDRVRRQRVAGAVAVEDAQLARRRVLDVHLEHVQRQDLASSRPEDLRRTRYVRATVAC